MYQYNENNNNDIWQKVVLGAGIALIVAIIVGLKNLFEYLF